MIQNNKTEVTKSPWSKRGLVTHIYRKGNGAHRKPSLQPVRTYRSSSSMVAKNTLSSPWPPEGSISLGLRVSR